MPTTTTNATPRESARAHIANALQVLRTCIGGDTRDTQAIRAVEGRLDLALAELDAEATDDAARVAAEFAEQGVRYTTVVEACREMESLSALARSNWVAGWNAALAAQERAAAGGARADLDGDGHMDTMLREVL